MKIEKNDSIIIMQRESLLPGYTVTFNGHATKGKIRAQRMINLQITHDLINLSP